MRVKAAVLAVLLAAGCSGGSTKTEATPSPTPRTAYTDLTPPTSPGVGDFDDLLSNRAYIATQGYLASQLLEPATLTGTGGKQLVGIIQGAAGDPAPARDLLGTTAAGLGYRPLLAKGVTLPKVFATVVRSEYTGDEVTGASGAQALRIQWSGAIHYDVLYQGKPYTFSYSLKIAYLFSADPRDGASVILQFTAPRSVHVAPAHNGCLAKGVILPLAGTITSVDDSEGPYPQSGSGSTCPV